MSAPVKVSAVLARIGACNPALRWVRKQERAGRVTFHDLWMAAENPDWMRWLASQLFCLDTADIMPWWPVTAARSAYSAGAARCRIGWRGYALVEAAFERVALRAMAETVV